MKKSFAIPFLILFFTFLAKGQNTQPSGYLETLKGNIRSVSVERTYLVMKGLNVASLKVPISYSEFNDAGQLTLDVSYGKDGIEQRTSYERIDGTVTTSVRYLDRNGNEIKTVSFSANANIPSAKGLCPAYSSRTENIPHTKEFRDIDTCLDGSNRAVTTRDYDSEDKLIREIRTDALKRSWDGRFTYNAKGNLINFRYFVDDKVLPQYWQSVDYVDIQLDAKGNIVSYYGAMTDSLNGNKIVDQWKETFAIKYR